MLKKKEIDLRKEIDKACKELDNSCYLLKKCGYPFNKLNIINTETINISKKV